MNITNITRINIKKLKEYMGKAMFLIVPIAILITLSIVVSSQVNNLRSAAETSVFETIEEQSTLLSIKKELDVDPRDIRAFFNREDTNFSEADLAVIQTIDNVDSAIINSPAPITNIYSSNLFDGINVKIGQLIGLENGISGLYTSEEFEYIEGELIPMILNASAFIEEYEDWGGETEIILDMRGIRESGGDPSNLMPQKQRAITYEKDDLIGKEITIEIGGFDAPETMTYERSDSGRVMHKLTNEEIQENEYAREESVSQYWNYEELAKIKSYTFVVVGVIESESDRFTYVPEEFVSHMMSEYIQNQLLAKNETEVSLDDLNSIYAGWTYDGTELKSSTFGLFGGGGGTGLGTGMGRPPEENEETAESYTIPGLVVELSDDGSEEVLGIYSEPSVYDDAVRTGDTIVIKTSSVLDRAQVIEDLNEMGYAYQDLSDLDVVENLENTLTKASTWLVISFIGLSVAVIILTMSKFVSESRRDIGIFRAIGMTKTNILTMFVSQAVLYSFIGYLIGTVVGILSNLVISGAVNSWFDKFIGSTIEETFNVVNQVDSSIFRNIDWSSLEMYSIVLLVITLVISFIPALQASSISPVEAIRGE